MSEGVYEMMHKGHFVHRVGKPKNGCMDAETAGMEWQKKYDSPDAITDMLGPNPKFAQRVAIKEADLVRIQDSQIKSQGYTLADAEKKKATEEDIKKADHQMQGVSKYQKGASGARSHMDMAKAMMDAKAVAASSGSADVAAFSHDGKAAQVVPNLQDTGPEKERGMRVLR
eukprot:2137252-Pyramimonas_sp.AAC.1